VNTTYKKQHTGTMFSITVNKNNHIKTAYTQQCMTRKKSKNKNKSKKATV